MAKIDVLVDGTVVGQAQYNISRPDVLAALPQYQNANAGFQYDLDTSKLTNGTHSFSVRETATTGAVKELQSVKFNVQNQNLPTIGDINSPWTGSTFSGITNFRGWFLNGKGISKIDVLVDGTVVGQAQYNISRPDVLAAFPQYQNANAGYQYDLDTTKISNGSHSFSVRATAIDGSTKDLQSVQFNVKNVLSLPAIGDINSPWNGATFSGTANVRGWFLDGNGISKIDVLVDGSIVGQAQCNISRSDVLAAFPQYQNANSGYQYNLDTTKLSNGTHSFSVRETATNGSTKDLPSVKFSVQNVVALPGMGDINSPSAGDTISGTANVRGWLLNGKGVSNVDVLVDGNIIGQAQYGISRPDVLQVFPQYQNANAGYQYQLDSTQLANGTHTLTVRSTSSDGSTTVLQNVKLNVQNLINMPGIGDINSPGNGSIINGIENVRGWFLDGSEVEKVDILVDNHIVGQAQYGSSRPDVSAVYPDYQNSNAGYEYGLDTKILSNGLHTITVQETGNNGKTTVLKSLSVNVENLDNLPTLRYLDWPTAGLTVNGITNVRGWYLDGSGVANIDVYLDGNNIGQAQYGISRTDVQNAYPGYFNGNSGFQFALNTLNFPDGQHTLTLLETGKSGKTDSISVNIIISNGNPYLTLDLMKPANITATDIINFFNAKNHADSALKQYAQSFIDAQNRYGVNAQYLVSHAIWETGWGGSKLISYKNNLYGYGAYDSCPFTCGYYFQSVPDSIFRVAYQIRVDYLNASGGYYNGPNLVGMNVRYATDQNWKNGIANLMQGIKSFDYTYYSGVNELGMSTISPPALVRDIPAGLPHPTDTIISYPNGIVAGTTATATLRSLPYVSASTVLGTVAQNTTVNVLGYNTDVTYNPGSATNYAFHWFRVSVNGQTGWLYGGNLYIPNMYQVNSGANAVNICTDPTGSGIITSVGNGAFLRVVTSNAAPVIQNGWYNVYLPNSTATGWISGTYLNQWIN